MAKMRAVQVARAGGSLEFVERDVPEPARGEVRVSVEARGVCHSDSFTVEGLFPGRAFPRIHNIRFGPRRPKCYGPWIDRGRSGRANFSVTEHRPPGAFDRGSFDRSAPRAT